jgi:hypothetical protein
MNQFGENQWSKPSLQPLQGLNQPNPSQATAAPPATKGSNMQAISQYRGTIQNDKDRYIDIIVPIEFKAKMELEEGLQPGSSAFAGNEFNDKVRIRWLQKQTSTLIEINEKEMKEHTIKVQHRMNTYVKECLRMVK